MKLRKLFVYSLLVICGIYCISCKINEATQNASSSNLCGELAGSNYTKTSLSELVCIAQDSIGNFYVVDQEMSSIRCFISSGDTLYRKEVQGSSIFSEKYYSLSLEGGSQLRFSNNSGKWKDVYIGPGHRCLKCDSIFSNQTLKDPKCIECIDGGWEAVCNYLDSGNENFHSLTSSDAGAIKNFAVRNFLPATHIEYLAQQKDGHVLMVSRNANNDWDGTVVVHYGAVNYLQVRTVTRFLRASDGGSTWIDFMIGSMKARAYFGVKLDLTGITQGPSNIILQGDTLNLDRITPTTQYLSELGFECAHKISW